MRAAVLAALLGAALASGCGGGEGDSGADDDGGGSGPVPGDGNRPPALGAISFTLDEDSELSGQTTASDPESDALTFARTGEPARGTVVSFDAGGAFVYRPHPDQTGSDSFAIRVTDAAGNAVSGTISITIRPVNDPPVATNDVMRVDGAALASIDVLANDRDPDGDALTVHIAQPAPAGTVSVNADGSIHLAGLPGGFRGLTTFRYRVIDASGASAEANAAIFVGTDPFRAVFAGNVPGAGGAEIHMTDFVAVWRVSAADEASLRLRGFAAADDGSTIAYRREDSRTGASDLSFVRTLAPERQVRVALPAGHALAQDGTGSDQFTVSPDGQWIGLVLRAPDGRRLPHLLSVNEPGNLRSLAPDGTAFSTQLRFSIDSRQLYFLAGENAQGLHKSLFRAAVAGGAPSRLSSPAAVGGGDDIVRYAVSADQARIALQAVRGDDEGLYYLNPALPGVEQRISQTLVRSERIVSSTLEPGATHGRALTRVGYTTETSVRGLRIREAWVAEVGADPEPRRIASGARAVALRSDDAALAYARTADDPSGEEIVEVPIDGPGAPETIGSGNACSYDAPGEVAILRQLMSGNAAPVYASAVRGSFGRTERMGSAGRASWYADLSGAPRAVAILGEGPPGNAPADVRLVIVNAWMPDAPIALADFESPLGLTSEIARVVTY